ncbi:MAG: DUF697 domain-containing protein [Alphaproteobacteria bacterium]|nr:DUF697 domain-containing protein [Alphaproteobacteria bacterium]
MSDFCNVSSHPEVNRLVETCGYATAALTILPIPGSEVLGVMPLHVGMVIGIANHYGRKITKESATQLILQIGATVGLSLVGSRIATTAAKFVLPGLGGLVAAPFMYASTLAIGAVADAYFSTNGDLSDEQMRAVYERTIKSAKKSYNPEEVGKKDAVDQAKAAVNQANTPAEEPAAEPTDPMSRLKRAKTMLEEGLIDQAEFDAVRDRILKEL